MNVTAELLEECAQKVKAEGKDLKSPQTQTEVHMMVQSVVEERKSVVHKAYGLEGLANKPEVILHSALAKYQADPDFTKKMEKINQTEQTRMVAVFEG